MVVVVVESVGDDVEVRDGAGVKKLVIFDENSLVMPIFVFFRVSSISGSCDMVVNVVGLVWMEIEVVLVTSGSVWVLALSRTAVGAKQCCPWPAIFHFWCSSYSPFTIPLP